MRDKLECPGCGCITTAYEQTTDRPPYIETWNCGVCGKTNCFHVAKPESGFDTFVHELGFDKIDLFGKVEAMKLAFDAGRGFEAGRTTKQLKEMNKSLEELVKLPMAKIQAE